MGLGKQPSQCKSPYDFAQVELIKGLEFYQASILLNKLKELFPNEDLSDEALEKIRAECPDCSVHDKIRLLEKLVEELAKPSTSGPLTGKELILSLIPRHLHPGVQSHP